MLAGNQFKNDWGARLKGYTVHIVFRLSAWRPGPATINLGYTNVMVQCKETIRSIYSPTICFMMDNLHFLYGNVSSRYKPLTEKEKENINEVLKEYGVMKVTQKEYNLRSSKMN